MHFKSEDGFQCKTDISDNVGIQIIARHGQPQSLGSTLETVT